MYSNGKGSLVVDVLKGRGVQGFIDVLNWGSFLWD